MSQIPVELEKVNSDIEKSMNNYLLMEPFNYKFTPEELHKKWLAFAGPKEVLDLIESRKLILDKDKVTFME